MNNLSLLAHREDAYYRAWMAYGGESRVKSWSKRRAMFWGLLLEHERDAAYARGCEIGERLGKQRLVQRCDMRLQWFLSKAVVASVFDATQFGHRYELHPRAGDPWAPLLVQLARALAMLAPSDSLPPELPARAPLEIAGNALLLERAASWFGTKSRPVFSDILTATDQEAREIRYALTRNDRASAQHWYELEWSFRAKNSHRKTILRQQQGRCGCCGSVSDRLELNHVQKVREFGRSIRENLEALCPPCHRFFDATGKRCHRFGRAA